MLVNEPASRPPAKLDVVCRLQTHHFPGYRDELERTTSMMCLQEFGSVRCRGEAAKSIEYLEVIQNES
jgi:hypothetical protein